MKIENKIRIPQSSETLPLEREDSYFQEANNGLLVP